MKRFIFSLITLVTLSARADLTTSQKGKCAEEAINKVLKTYNNIRLVEGSINLQPTAMRKYNVVVNALDFQESDQNYVSFLAVGEDGNNYEGEIILVSEKSSRHYNNTTVTLNDLVSNVPFKCTLTFTQFVGNKDSFRDILLSDFNLSRIK